MGERLLGAGACDLNDGQNRFNLRRETADEGNGVLSVEANAAGHVNGKEVVKMQRAITHQRDEAAFNRRLDTRMKARPREDPIRMQWMGLNRYSSQFVGSLPTGRYTIMSNAYLEVAFEMYFGTECKAARPHVGTLVRKRRRNEDADHFLDAYKHALPRTASV